MFSSGDTRPEIQPQKAQPANTDSKDNGDCPNFIAEKDNCYPLCDNPACTHKNECCKSVHMAGPYDKK